MKVAVTGAKGLLGSRIVKILKSKHNIIPFDHGNLEICDINNVMEVITGSGADIVVHCAAWANPDKCKENPEQAYLVNSLGTRNIAVACQEIGAKMVYISTDFVFNGKKGDFYTEFDKEDPINIYGKSKYQGELFVKGLLDKYFIARVSWLFDEEFVKIIIDKARSGEEFSLIEDKFSSPTYVNDVVLALNELIETNLYGIYHIANHGMCSRVGQAQEVLEQSGYSTTNLKGHMGKNEKKWVDIRPDKTPLKPELIELQNIFTMPSYSNAVKRCLEKVMSDIK